MLASLVVAITVIPALSLLLLPRRIRERQPPVVAWTRIRYEALLRQAMQAPRLVIAVAAGLTAAGIALLPFFGATFLLSCRKATSLSI